MDYKKWSQEYYEEAQKIQRNINKLKARQKSAPQDERQTIASSIMQLQSIYYECVHTAGYLLKIHEEHSRNVA